MKMAKWYIEDSYRKNQGRILVLKGDNLKGCIKKKLYQGDKTSFTLIYSAAEKMIGYQFEFLYDETYPTTKLFNGFAIFYKPTPATNTDDFSYEVLFEDQVLRLVCYEHKCGHTDYVLVGRWRSQNSDKIGATT